MAPQHTLCLGLLCLTLGGCACVATEQDWTYKLTQKQRAASCYTERYSSEQRKCLSCDFRSGFKEGYYETSIGKDCRVPPVAPPKYWSAHYQSCEGQVAVQDWFRGYQEGIAAASSSGHRYFNQVPVSAEAPIVNRTACGMCRSTDPCNCSVASPVSGPDYPFGLESEGPASSQPAESSTAYKASVMEPSSLGYKLPEQPAEAFRKARLSPSTEIGLIGGSGATERGLFGPMDRALFQK